MRMLHTMLRVGDMQRSIDFYTKVLGMQLLRTSDNPEYKYSLAFVGYGPEASNTVIELTLLPISPWLSSVRVETGIWTTNGLSGSSPRLPR